MKKRTKIYISYAWGENQNEESDREYLVNQLYNSLIDDGFEVVRDKFDLSYKGSITQFMQEIGKGDKIILVLSEKYAKSVFCMFELYEVGRNSKFSKDEFVAKIFPVFVEFIDFANPDVLNTYYDYWEAEEKKWKNLIDKRSDKLSMEQFARYDKVKLIHQNIGLLMDWIIDMNSLNPKLLSENNFAIIKKALEGNIKTNFNLTQTTGNMTDEKQKLLELVDKAEYGPVISELENIYGKMTSGQKNTYSILKKEYKIKIYNSDIHFPDRMKMLIRDIYNEKK